MATNTDNNTTTTGNKIIDNGNGEAHYSHSSGSILREAGLHVCFKIGTVFPSLPAESHPLGEERVHLYTIAIRSVTKNIPPTLETQHSPVSRTMKEHLDMSIVTIPTKPQGPSLKGRAHTSDRRL